MDNVKIAKQKEEEEETEEAVSDNIRKRRVLEPVVERDTLQPTSKPQFLTSASTAPAAISDSPISETPNASPSNAPRRRSPPTETPSGSLFPSSAPSDDPSGSPSYGPSTRPSLRPSSSYNPSTSPSSAPSLRPSSSYIPSANPSSAPSLRPSSSYYPSASPSSASSSSNTPSESESPSPSASLPNNFIFLRTASHYDTPSESESPSPFACPPHNFEFLLTPSYYDTPSESESPSPSTPISNNQTGITFDNHLPRSLNIFFICLPIGVFVLFVLAVILIGNKQWELCCKDNVDNRRINRQVNRRINRQVNRRINIHLNASATYPFTGNEGQYEREMENRRINRQLDPIEIYNFTGNGSREEVNTHDAYPSQPSPVRSNYVRNNTLPLSLPLEDRTELYNKAFISNGNQLILKNKHIVFKINADESDIEVCLDIESDASKDYFSNNKNFIKEESDTVEDSSKTKMMTDGTCSICIDEFIENDQIVYSELCSHVYHKHCMVSYLATNAQQEIHGSPTLDITDNPCPSCRQNYCKIRDEDLPWPITALGTTSSFII
jgi:hypothetical protein